MLARVRLVAQLTVHQNFPSKGNAMSSYLQKVELDQAMTFVDLSIGDEFLTAYQYARLSGVQLHPIPEHATEIPPGAIPSRSDNASA